MRIRARLEFKPQYCWVGAFWKRSQPTWIDDADQKDNAIWRTRKAERVDIWVCLVPCIPIHVLLSWQERLLTEQETLDDMLTL